MKLTLKQNIIFIIVFICASLFVHFKDINKLPTSIHAWAQSDHYALALGFYNDGFNFFKPTTFALDLQFPAKESVENPKGITSVDFPILHYTVALAMKILGTTAPWVFRIISLLISFLALFYLFRTLSSIKNVWVASLITAFICFQPIYCYYQDGFHVSSAAFNIFLIGFSSILRYFHSKIQKHFNWGIFFLTLAALMRFTEIISLLALGGTYFIISFKEKKIHKNIITISVGVIIILAYFIHNKIVAAEYGSLFLGHPMPPNSLADLIYFIKRIFISYSMGFLPFLHLALVIIILIGFKKFKTQETSFPWLIWSIISFIGTLSFSILMMWGISAHDYYSLDTWLPFLSITLTYLLLNINYQKIQKETLIIATVLFTIGSFSVALENQLKKYREDAIQKNTDVVICDFSDSSEFLNSHIDKTKKTLIICGEGWNTPMIGWQRKTYRIHNINKTTLKRLGNETYNYIVVHNSSISEENISIIRSYCTLINDNKKVSIYKQK